MARKNNDDMLMEDELAAAFLEDDATTMLEPDEPMLSVPEEEVDSTEELIEPEEESVEPSDEGDDGWETGDDFPGQLAVDVYETADKLVIKARTAGIKKSDLNVSIHDSILTISGVLSGGEDDQTTRWHIQECYWGEFSRTIALPVQVREDENSVKAELRDGVLTITFEKEKVEAPKIIHVD
ncbi:Hsp20/alpha crystallin family protein [Candidatus Saccharibacteria bacterium]|nr:Hsp20/alpha crystallin family protein [Candidatus Saccharibacteria bacterium]